MPGNEMLLAPGRNFGFLWCRRTGGGYGCLVRDKSKACTYWAKTGRTGSAVAIRIVNWDEVQSRVRHEIPAQTVPPAFRAAVYGAVALIPRKGVPDASLIQLPIPGLFRD
jgi:hypothetical protein